MDVNLKLNLGKASDTLKLCLQKAGMNFIPTVDVAFNMDVSGSYEDEHLDGTTTKILGRLVPWGLVLDPDKKLDLFSFSSNHGGMPPAYYVGEVNAQNYHSFLRDEVIRKVPNWNGGTLYAPVIQMNLEFFGWLPQTQPFQPGKSSSGGGLLSRFLPKAKEAAKVPSASSKPRKSLILHNTDGGNDDEKKTEALLEEMEMRGDQVYIMFFGFSNEGATFRFIKRMAERFKNTGIYIPPNIPTFLNMSDEELNEKLITKELTEWLKK